jgi:hypothetical protein
MEKMPHAQRVHPLRMAPILGGRLNMARNVVGIFGSFEVMLRTHYSFRMWGIWILTAVCFGPGTADSATRPMQKRPHRADIQVRHPAAEALELDPALSGIRQRLQAFVAVGVGLLGSCQSKMLRQADTGHQRSSSRSQIAPA